MLFEGPGDDVIIMLDDGDSSPEREATGVRDALSVAATVPVGVMAELVGEVVGVVAMDGVSGIDALAVLLPVALGVLLAVFVAVLDCDTVVVIEGLELTVSVLLGVTSADTEVEMLACTVGEIVCVSLLVRDAWGVDWLVMVTETVML